LIDLTFGNDYHHNETIPGSLLTMLCFYLPVSVFAVFSMLLGPQGDLHAAMCAYIFAMASKIFVVACLKNYAGYLRPNFYDMCKFNPETLLCDDETTSARESFPSGHAATALSSMTVLSLYLLGKVCGGIKQRGVKEVRGDPREEVWTPSLPLKMLAVLSVGPVVLGMFIATSRVRDNWHHPADVLCGAVIGAACALFAHTLWQVDSQACMQSIESNVSANPSSDVTKQVSVCVFALWRHSTCDSSADSSGTKEGKGWSKDHWLGLGCGRRP
jgi:diacylglycerol diphosphate phosphatase / phosphatidate phosphatase